MSEDLERVNFSLGKCLTSAFWSVSNEKREQLMCLLKTVAIGIEDVLQNPIKIPSYLLMRVSRELGASHAICEIIMMYQFNRAIVR